MMNTIKILGFVFLFVLLLPMASLADEARQSESATQQQLQTLEQQLAQQKQELENERLRAKQMEKEVDCNWSLLNAYKACEDQFSKTSPQYLQCATEAKQNGRRCMSAISEVRVSGDSQSP